MHPVAFAIRVEKSYKAFVDDEIFDCTERKLLEVLREYSQDALVYVFMPDHVHLILQCSVDNKNVLDAVDMFKQKTGYMFYETDKSFVWHSSYYDHIIRDERDVYNQVMYILNNPVRAGLVEYWKEYKYKGSTVYDLNSWD